MDIKDLEIIEIEKIEYDFFNGNIDSLNERMCPKCKTGKLLFSVYKELVNSNAIPGRRYKGSVNIYCIGECNIMLTHANCYIPVWAENIENWEDFSKSLY